MTPVEKAIELLIGMDARIRKHGKAAEVLHAEKVTACQLESKDLNHTITRATSQIELSQAKIETETSKITELNAASAAANETIRGNGISLSNATGIREKEATVFHAEETELEDIIDTVQRAIGILERELHKTPSLMQGLATQPVVTALKSLVQGSVFNAADASRLSTLIQRGGVDADAGADDDDDDDLTFGAPAAAVYTSSSGGIVGVLEDLLDQAQRQLVTARKAEATARHNFKMMEQSLTIEIRNAKSELEDAQKRLTTATQVKTEAEADLSEAEGLLSTTQDSLKTLMKECEKDQKDYEAEVDSRQRELDAVAAAMTSLRGITAAALAQEHETSFLQHSSLPSPSDLAGFEVARRVRDLAKKEGTTELSQLADRVSSVLQQSTQAGDDPFEKVRGLISDLIRKLESDAQTEQTEKERCDRELEVSEEKYQDKSAAVQKLTVNIDRWSSTSNTLKAEIAAIQTELSDLIATQAKLDKECEEQAAMYANQTADMQVDLQGANLALKALREYYASEDIEHEAASESATGVIGLLEVIRRDFTDGLALLGENAAKAKSSCDAAAKQSGIERMRMEQDVKYKTKEQEYNDKLAGEATADRADEQAQLDAVTTYLDATKKQCTAKAMTYEERKERRSREIQGLKDALSILESETSETMLVQKHVRGAKRFLQTLVVGK